MFKQFIEPLDSRRMFVHLFDFTTLATEFSPWVTSSNGDYNYDGTVNLEDFTVLQANFGLGVDGDHNADKTVNAADFDFIRNNPTQFSNGMQIAASAGFGDANMDGRINKFDFRSLGNSFNRYVIHAEGWSNGDFTMNGRVTIKDFTLAAQNLAERD